jgi:predicted nucleotidyltransferase
LTPPFTRDQLRALDELSTVAFPDVPIVVVGAHTMSLVGFEHVFVRPELFEVEGQRILVARPDVLALLKIVAYLDRPAEREHDLGDLLFLTEQFVAADDERRWNQEILDRQLPFDEAGAFLLGRAMAEFAGPRDREALGRFFNCVADGSDATLARLLRVAPPSCRGSEERVLARIDALRTGLEM